MSSKYTTLDMDRYPPETINVQPTSVLATEPQPIVPQGLGYLSNVDQILVHQKIELLEALCGCETRNKYEVKNTLGQRFLFAQEDTDCLTRLCCGRMRPFDMDLFDNQGNKVLKFERPLACMAFCFPCCLQSLIVKSSEREVIGSVHQEWSIVTPHFSIFLKDGETQVGRITKQWSGLGREVFTKADHFGIEFPMDLDVKMKAVLLGACILIDFMFFERK